MSDQLRLLHLATCVVGLGDVVLIWPMTRDAAGRRWLVWPLLALTAGPAVGTPGY